MTKNILLTLTLILVSYFAIAQTSLTGKITDAETGEEMIGANIVVKKNGVFIQGKSTDIDGNFNIRVDPGTYDMEFSYTGYSTQNVEGVVAAAGQATKVDIQLGLGSGVLIEEIVVTSYKVPLIKQDETTAGSTITFGRNRSRSSGVSRRKSRKRRKRNKRKKEVTQNAPIIIKGSRSNSTNYHIDGSSVNGVTTPKEKQIPTEEYNHIVENEFLSSKEKPLSTFSIDVDNASYSNTRRYLNNNQMPPKDAVRIEEFINYFNYDYQQPDGNTPFSINTEISDCPWSEENKLVHIGLQGYELPKEQMPPSNLVFLLDVSGSMRSPNKLPLLKKAFQLLVQQLRKEDKVSIVVYAGASGLVLPPTSGSDKHKITESLARLRTGGGTAGAAGIQLAYEIAEKAFIKNGNNRVILATDGDFNVGVSSNAELVKLIEEKRKSGVFLSVLGFGRGNYKDIKMEQLADNGNGNYAYIDNFEEAKKVFVKEIGGTLHAIAKDVKLQIVFNPKHVEEYRLIGYENRKLKNEDFANDKKDAGDLGAGHTVTALYEIIPTEFSKKSIHKKEKRKAKNQLAKNNEDTAVDWMTIKLRYKKPNEAVSQLLEVTARDAGLELKKTSDNFRFSAAVASFGMLMRDSQFKGNYDFKKVRKLAKGALGKDKNGYRKGFLELVKKAEELNIRMTAKK